jgi:hypothetical protein
MRTIKEKAREYALGNCGIETFDYLQNAFIAGVEFSQRWISVDEELPEQTMEIKKVGDYRYTKVQVLVRSKNRYGTSTRSYNPNHGWHWSNTNDDESITHWRPIELA